VVDLGGLLGGQQLHHGEGSRRRPGDAWAARLRLWGWRPRKGSLLSRVRGGG
jgi:hypothetical protein